MTKRTRRSGQSGQAAVEAVFSLPVMLVLFLIGFELFAITWNAQFVHVESRYEVLKKADHKACVTGDHAMTGGIREGVGVESTSSARVTGDARMWQRSRTHTLRQRAVIVCGN